ncbi:MAG: citrate/2-methylcitrate synthase [Candidatus Sericytochromatia bacterium]
MSVLSPWCTAAEATSLLGISRSTLYAYVSRGLIQSREQPSSRAHLYRRDDLQHLLQRREARRQPDAGSLHNLDWGLPVLSSRITQVREGMLFYRDTPLADWLELPLHALIAALWQLNTLPPAPEGTLPDLPWAVSELGFAERLQIWLAWVVTQDLRAADLSPEGVLASCLRLQHAIYTQALDSWCSEPAAVTIPGLSTPRERRLAHVLLVISADHELNPSAFTARCVASARGTPHAALMAALACLSGQRHGGQTLLLTQLLGVCEAAGSARQGLRVWLQSGQAVPGLGHRLYPAGDPRWCLLRERLLCEWQDDARLQQILALESACAEAGLPLPTLDFALCAGALLLPQLSLRALDWFALGRVLGWLAHIQEQFAQPGLIRPRARPV